MKITKEMIVLGVILVLGIGSLFQFFLRRKTVEGKLCMATISPITDKPIWETGSVISNKGMVTKDGDAILLIFKKGAKIIETRDASLKKGYRMPVKTYLEWNKSGDVLGHIYTSSNFKVTGFKKKVPKNESVTISYRNKSFKADYYLIVKKISYIK